MENLLCDELLQEIFTRVPSTSSSSVSLVSKRWLNLYRTSITSLSICINQNNNPSSISSFLSNYPHLSSISVVSESNPNSKISSCSEHVLMSIASNFPNLHLLRFLAGPISPSSLISVSNSCKHLTSLHVSSPRPLNFHWLKNFPFLKDLSFTNSSPKYDDYLTLHSLNSHPDYDSDSEEETQVSGKSGLCLETLCLSGIGAEGHGMKWLWKNCKNLRNLRLKNCESIGYGDSFTSFFNCLKNLEQIEVRTSRTIVDVVLFQLSEHCNSLDSLLLYDGGSREGLHRFITSTKSSIKRIDFRLPLDLDNYHISAIGECFNGLVSLRLQSCCLITGEALKNLGADSMKLEELALINCDVVEREPGLLTTLGQNLKGLRKLDLSFNEMLVDKELVSMLASCKNLVDIKLRGCRGITNSAMVLMCKNCKGLENVDIRQCSRVGVEGVDVILMALPKLISVLVEDIKVSSDAKKWVSKKFIQVIDI